MSIEACDQSFDTKLLWDALSATSKNRPSYSSKLHAEELYDHFTSIAERIFRSTKNCSWDDQTDFKLSKIVPQVTPADSLKFL